MGTWIEISSATAAPPAPYVVPLVGTWIEIVELVCRKEDFIVVPLVGTWIEISRTQYLVHTRSRSPCGNVD